MNEKFESGFPNNQNQHWDNGQIRDDDYYRDYMDQFGDGSNSPEQQL